MVRQGRNNEQLAIARLHQTTCIMNSKKDARIPEIHEFLPHPHEWLHFQEEKRLRISKTCALDILANFKSLDSEFQGVLEPYLQEIEGILRG